MMGFANQPSGFGIGPSICFSTAETSLKVRKSGTV